MAAMYAKVEAYYFTCLIAVTSAQTQWSDVRDFMEEIIMYLLSSSHPLQSFFNLVIEGWDLLIYCLLTN